MTLTHDKIRSVRMIASRSKGTHQRAQWLAILEQCNGRCVRCGGNGTKLVRDHIVPIYQGGSDGLDNIQPLCGPCNNSKGPESFNWLKYRRKHGYENDRANFSGNGNSRQQKEPAQNSSSAAQCQTPAQEREEAERQAEEIKAYARKGKYILDA